jgi:hypothetical protein
MAGRLAQALGRFRAKLVARPSDPRRSDAEVVSELGFDQFDPGGDVHAIGAAFGGDPHGNAIRKSYNL